KFGVSITDADSILAAFRNYRWLQGLHVHVGSQGCSLELLTSAARAVNSLRQKIAAEAGREIRFVDIGGGLPAAYREDQTPPTPAEYADALRLGAGDLWEAGVPLITE